MDLIACSQASDPGALGAHNPRVEDTRSSMEWTVTTLGVLSPQLGTPQTAAPQRSANRLNQDVRLSRLDRVMGEAR